jgi:hypothetical protein
MFINKYKIMGIEHDSDAKEYKKFQIYVQKATKYQALSKTTLEDMQIIYNRLSAITDNYIKLAKEKSQLLKSHEL